MSRNTLNKLTDRQCKAAKPRDKTYKLSDGGGLYLEVSPTGSKYWRMKYRRPSDKKEDRLAFGVYPTISLQDAREKRDNTKKLLVKGIDPKAEQRAAKAEEKGAFTFETIGRQWVESHQMWNEAHRKRVLRSLEMYIFPHIGNSDIRKLEAMTILPLFKKVDDAGKHDTANRLKQRVKDIIHSARLSGIKTEIITNDLDVRLMQYETKHHAALHPRDLPDFFTRLGSFRGNPLTRLAIELTMLTFVRSSELRFARWKEFDLDRAEWIIPKKREPIDGVRFSTRGTKTGKDEHIVLLSRQAVSIVKQLRELSGSYDVVFPNERNTKGVMSENTVNKALRLMGYNTQEDVTGHGFRATACSSLMESGLWQEDAVERQMSHKEYKDVKRAYKHKADYLEERKLMLQWWADYLDANREIHISPYEFGRRTRRD
ncbi:TPA: tyrosine-type recombinase/integrase [Escherichia coli]|uniref:tyrosine-type recombinase/integrase n=1 Tax=Escherichia coli TaxID=562 RepID=UPI000A2EBB5A|nr:integrase arm-type DNA-binding domain-containing protein [Escherichia coli]EEW7660129.1 DUF4102 domain-containing protein [Escherichia coli]EEY5704768.1 DUF4102 domain-containing protein [Escherichia coli]EFK5491726.1 DUF4102 domain-containing protein [Escherichia coli]EFO4665140.1 integrase arm-type DNA-binding domain-containing protein [Escherichia coli]EGD4803933.1 DUF4102 domain-containing protein [Escherichia coli]